MKNPHKLLLAVCSGLILFSACSKDEDDKKDTTPTTTKTKKEYLLEGKWQMTSNYRVVKLSGTVVDADSTMDDCEKDNTMTFLTSGKMAEDQGSVKCTSSDPQVDSNSTWKLSDDYSKLTIFMADGGSGSGMEVPFSVTSLTSSELKVAYKADTVQQGMPMSIDMKIAFKNIK